MAIIYHYFPQMCEKLAKHSLYILSPMLLLRSLFVVVFAQMRGYKLQAKIKTYVVMDAR